LLHDIRCSLDIQQLIVECVTSAYNLNIIHVMSIDRGESNSAVVHLSCENFISEEPISEYTTVTVRTVQTLLSCDIWQIAQHSMHCVVLLSHIVQVLSMLIDLVVAENTLEQQERVEVLVAPAGSIVENSDT